MRPVSRGWSSTRWVASRSPQHRRGDDLRGGNTGCYTPAFNMGVNVIVVNADKIVVTGNKALQKKYYTLGVRGKPGSMKEETTKLHARQPARVIEKAIKGMLPKNRMGRETFTHLKVYAGAEHPHAAQNPTDVTADVAARRQGAHVATGVSNTNE